MRPFQETSSLEFMRLCGTKSDEYMGSNNSRFLAKIYFCKSATWEDALSGQRQTFLTNTVS
jgi:hypothetical protein